MLGYSVCIVPISPLRLDANDRSEMVSQLLFGEVVEVLEHTSPWVKIQSQHDNYVGFCDEKHLLKLSEKEVRRHLEGLIHVHNRELTLESNHGKLFVPRGAFIKGEVEFSIGSTNYVRTEALTHFTSVLECAKSYLNTPYLWGGKTPFGIDCSGFTQSVFRCFAINLPRDAYQQIEYGTSIAYEDCEPGDLAFFKNEAGRVHHVGIVLSQTEIIHASGHVKLDDFNNSGIFSKESNKFTHHLCAIKRL